MLKKVSMICMLFGSSTLAADMMDMSTTEDPYKVCVTDDSTPTVNTDEDVQYVRAFFGDGDAMNPSPVDSKGESRGVLMVPYALDVCSATAPISGPLGMFSCEDDGETITYKSFYNIEGNCVDGQETGSFRYNATALMGTPFAFNCGASSAHISVQLAPADTTCSGPTAMFAVGQCVYSYLPPELETPSFSQWYCGTDSDGNHAAAVNFYTRESGMCQDETFCMTAPLEYKVCKFFLQRSDGTLVYAKPTGCTSTDFNEDGDGDGDNDDAASSHSVAFALVFSFIFAFIRA
jgi:hypothetical protein